MRRRKFVRLSSLFLSLVIAIGVIAFNNEVVMAATDATTGLEYSISGNQATITRFTAPPGFSGSLLVPSTLGGSTVTSIATGAFENGDVLTNITFSSGLTSISHRAFVGCDNLVSISLPNTLTSIGEYAFGNCYSLTEICIDPTNSTYKSVDGIVYSKDGTQLILCPEGRQGSFTIPSYVATISEAAFSGCRGLTNITIPTTVTSIGCSALSGCGLTSITLPNSIDIINDGLLSDCWGLTDVYIPNSVTSIGESAFGGCGNLASIEIPNSVENIGAYAFNECYSLTNIMIPSSVTNIDTFSFFNCYRLTSINVSEYNPVYKSNEGILYSKDGSILFDCPEGKRGSITIPNGVAEIASDAFSYSSSLTSITIPNSVINISDRAFMFCFNLGSAYFLGNAPTLGSDVFSGADSGFVVYFLYDKIGFSNPWNGYSTATFTPTPTPTVTPTPNTPTVSYRTHVQDVGWQAYVSDGEASGTSGQSKRLEAIKIKLDLEGIIGGIEYRTHVQDIGWQDFVADDALSGTSGQSKRLEAIQIRLTGEAANLYDVYYRVHAQDTGWLDWAKNGASSGTAGYSRRLEAIEIKLVAKGGAAPGATARPFIQNTEPIPPTGGTVSYKTHVQDVGWQGYVNDGAESGTSGQSKRLEGIQIKLNNIAGGIEYSTHVQDYGWMAFVANDAMSGTSGESKRLEAIKIRLTGAAADAFDVYYCVHAQNVGWLDWAKNGESAGTAGFSYRLEAIKIVLVEKGGPAPGATARPFVQG